MIPGPNSLTVVAVSYTGFQVLWQMVKITSPRKPRLFSQLRSPKKRVMWGKLKKSSQIEIFKELQSVLPDQTVTLSGQRITFRMETEIIKCNRKWCERCQNTEAMTKLNSVRPQWKANAMPTFHGAEWQPAESQEIFSRVKERIIKTQKCWQTVWALFRTSGWLKYERTHTHTHTHTTKAARKKSSFKAAHTSNFKPGLWASMFCRKHFLNKY